MMKLLHVGCGPKSKAHTTPGFMADHWSEIRLDIDPGVAPDVNGTMTDMRAVESSSVDAVFSAHNIEHLYPHEVPQALSEFLRVLSDDGFAVITCPDLKSVCELIAQDKLTDPAYIAPVGPIAPLDILYGHRPAMARGNLYMAHRCGFTQKVLTATLAAAGFRSVATACRPSSFDLWALASKRERNEAELKQLAREHFPGSLSDIAN
jgi:predicted SAM-dependent methyltransferase